MLTDTARSFNVGFGIGLFDADLVSGGMDGSIELPGAQGPGRIQTGEQPAAIKHLALGAVDTQGHALAVDITDLQGHHFIDPQPGAV